MRDPVEIGKALAGLVRRYVARELGDIARRLDALEARGADKAATVDEIRPLIEAEIAKGMLDLERRATDMLQRAIERIPTPRDGEPGPAGPQGPRGEPGPRGERGADGLGFDDLGFEARDAGRIIALRFARGDQVKEVELEVPSLIYQGIYRDGAAYRAGDAVTWAGSLWIAIRDTTAKPGDGSPDWRLAVKKGRDGK